MYKVKNNKIKMSQLQENRTAVPSAPEKRYLRADIESTFTKRYSIMFQDMLAASCPPTSL